MKVKLVNCNSLCSTGIGYITSICKTDKIVSLLPFSNRFPLPCIDKKRADKIYETCLKNGHHSVLRHAYFVFYIRCTKRASHQICRHKYLNITQSSDRYLHSDLYPDNVPSDVTTQLYASGTLQAWREFIEQRACKHAISEMQEIAAEIYKILKELDENFVKYLRGNKGRCSACEDKCTVINLEGVE